MEVAKIDLEKNMNEYKIDIEKKEFNKIFTLFKEIFKVLVELKK